MKRFFASLAALLALALMLSACSAAAIQTKKPGAPPKAPTGSATLEELCGENYQTYIIETITMQMGNRTDKTPDVVYFPIQEKAPLTDYVSIDETMDFTVDEEGHIVIPFPADTVTGETNGEQSSRIPRP